MPVAIFGDRKNGLPKSSGLSSIQAFSSRCHKVKRPSIFFASLMTIAKGCALGAGGPPGCGVPGGTPEADGGVGEAARGLPLPLPALAMACEICDESCVTEAQPESSTRATTAAALAAATPPRRQETIMDSTCAVRSTPTPPAADCECARGREFHPIFPR